MCFLQAARILPEIIQLPLVLKEAEAIFPQLFLALLLQVSFTMELTLQEVEIFWEVHQQHHLTPIRCHIPIPPLHPGTRCWAPNVTHTLLHLQGCGAVLEGAALRRGPPEADGGHRGAGWLGRASQHCDPPAWGAGGGQVRALPCGVMGGPQFSDQVLPQHQSLWPLGHCGSRTQPGELCPPGSGLMVPSYPCQGDEGAARCSA